VSIIRQLQVCLCTNNDFLSEERRLEVAIAFELCLKVHSNLRRSVRKDKLVEYQNDIDELLLRSVEINRASTKSACKSIKYHWPRHWSQTREELGCAPLEKSLERKLGETHKKYFTFTNKHGNSQVRI
jgi:hypothetical protein